MNHSGHDPKARSDTRHLSDDPQNRKHSGRSLLSFSNESHASDLAARWQQFMVLQKKQTSVYVGSERS